MDFYAFQNYVSTDLHGGKKCTHAPCLISGGWDATISTAELFFIRRRNAIRGVPEIGAKDKYHSKSHSFRKFSYDLGFGGYKLYFFHKHYVKFEVSISNNKMAENLSKLYKRL